MATVLALLAGAPAAAAVAVPATVERLAREADAVVQGRVERLESRWASDGRHIHTLVTLRTGRVLRGAAGERVVLRVAGGEVGDVGQRVDAAPAFEEGEEAVVFLRREARGTYLVHGMAQGKFRVERGQARPDLSAFAFVAAELPPAERRVEAMPLAELEERVRSAR